MDKFTEILIQTECYIPGSLFIALTAVESPFITSRKKSGGLLCASQSYPVDEDGNTFHLQLLEWGIKLWWSSNECEE